ncbi:MAG TPA: hypothetical protein VLT62_14605 [Candidatus Methylomirabilis sp.]|nr:hypothetical protein [Candidatus Methylomirabilis sp.]
MRTGRVTPSVVHRSTVVLPPAGAEVGMIALDPGVESPGRTDT